MELKCFRTLWGVTTPWPQTLDELQRVGCCGIEARVPLTVAERRQLADRLQASGLEYIRFQHMCNFAYGAVFFPEKRELHHITFLLLITFQEQRIRNGSG